MATIRAVIKAALTGDGTLTAILTGGILDGEDLPKDGLTYKDAPKQGDNVKIAPFTVIRWGTSTPVGALQLGAMNEQLEFWVYENKGYTDIDAAIRRITTLVDQITFAADDVQTAYFWRMLISAEMRADEIGFAPFRFARFNSIIRPIE